MTGVLSAWTLYFTLFLTFFKLTSLFPVQFFFKAYFFWPCTYRFTHQRANPWPLEWKQSLNHWSTWEVLVFYFKNAVFQQHKFVSSLYTCVCFFLCLDRMGRFMLHLSSVQFSSVTQLCPTLCNPTDCSTPGFPVHTQFWELAQTHVLWVSDAIQLSHPLSSPSPPAFNLSQHQGLF